MGGKSSKRKAAGGKWKHQLRLVILGIAASGKSTFARQMRLMHVAQSPWTEQELQVYYDIIAANIFDGLKEIAVGLKKANKECSDSANKKIANLLLEMKDYPVLNDQEVQRMQAFWKDAAVQKLWPSLRTEVSFNLPYYMDRVEEIAKPDYLPSSEDILHSRQRSTGATETTFVKDKVQFILMDLGGQKPERAKWDRIIAEGCKGVFYFVAVDEYDIFMPEDKNRSKLETSFQTWKELLTNPKLAEISIMLLLNKIDLLERNLATQGFDPILKRFPKFQGDKTKSGYLKFIKKMFVDAIPSTINTHYVSVFECCALDSHLMSDLFNEARAHILQRSLSTL